MTLEEKAWLNPYRKGDTLVFESNLKNIDTILVTEKTHFYTNENCNWIEIGTTQDEGINMTLIPKTCHNKFYCEGEISIIKSPNSETAPFFRIFGLEHSTASTSDSLIESEISLSTNGKNYKHAYVVESGVNANNYGNNYLKSFHWDKNEGLIRYEGADGEVFELVNYLKTGNEDRRDNRNLHR
ncbi:hypothetical protein SOM16_06330 [Pedobacter sp. CFBP9032]|nr:hypothetical protein [Pedobacter sp. CFBP9032]